MALHPDRRCGGRQADLAFLEGPKVRTEFRSERHQALARDDSAAHEGASIWQRRSLELPEPIRPIGEVTKTVATHKPRRWVDTGLRWLGIAYVAFVVVVLAFNGVRYLVGGAA